MGDYLMSEYTVYQVRQRVSDATKSWMSVIYEDMSFRVAEYAFDDFVKLHTGTYFEIISIERKEKVLKFVKDLE